MTSKIKGLIFALAVSITINIALLSKLSKQLEHIKQVEQEATNYLLEVEYVKFQCAQLLQGCDLNEQ